MTPTTLLLLHHAPSASLRRIADAVTAGAREETITGVGVVVADPLTASASDLLAADGYVLGTAAHFGYMSGALKHLFDRTFLQIGGALDGVGDGGAGTAGRPFGLWVHGRYDVTGAVRSVESITGALSWRRCAPVLEVTGEVDEAAEASAYDLGATLAATLSG